MRMRRAGALLPPFLLLAAVTGGQAGESAAVESQALEHVQVTATRRALPETEVAAAVAQVSERQFQATGPGVLAQSLRGLPGAYFQQTTPGQGIPIIRGLKGSQVLHLVDGMRLNNALFRPAPNQYLALVDPFAAERAEVVRGAAGTLHGADAMGGVVHILTAEPAFEGRDWSFERSVYAAYHSAADSRAARARVQGGRDGLAISAGASVQVHSDREAGGGRTQAPSGYRSQAADLKLLASLGPSSDLTLSIQALEQPATPRYDELVPGFGQVEPASARFEFRPNRRLFAHARYRSHASGKWYDEFELHLARQVITDDRVTQEYGSRLVDSEANESELDGLTAQFNSTLPGGAMLTWGGEYYTDAVASARNRLDIGTGVSEAVPGRFPDGSGMDSMAAYLAGEWRPGELLRAWAGLRYSRFRIDLPSSGEVAAFRLRPDALSFDLHLVYRLRHNLNLVGNLGRGFRPPNVFDLAALGPRPGNRFNVANPGLRPETVRSYDLGLKSAGRRWQSELFVFYMDYEDKITSVATGGFTPEGRTVVRSENANRAELYGLEAGFRWRPRESVEVYGVLNYSRGQERDAAGVRFPADRIPPVNGKLGISCSPSDRLRLDAFVWFNGDQDRLSPRDRDDPRIHPGGTPGWATFNVRLGWQARENVELGLNLENLADRAYREHGSGIDAPGLNIGLWMAAAWP